MSISLTKLSGSRHRSAWMLQNRRSRPYAELPFSTSHRLICQPLWCSATHCLSCSKIDGANPCHWSMLSNCHVAPLQRRLSVNRPSVNVPRLASTSLGNRNLYVIESADWRSEAEGEASSFRTNASGPVAGGCTSQTTIAPAARIRTTAQTDRIHCLYRSISRTSLPQNALLRRPLRYRYLCALSAGHQ